MLIISDFHDYYDGCITTVDKTNVYNRKEEYVKESLFKDPEHRFFQYLKDTHKKIKIYFCGKLYVYFLPLTKNGSIIKDMESFDKASHDLFKNEGQRKRARRYVSDLFDMMTLDYSHINIKYGSPIISNQGLGGESITNQCLKDVSFQKIVDPWTAYQEIEMFNSNELALEKMVPVDIDDKYRIAGHGFINESFKKRKDSRKRKQKNA